MHPLEKKILTVCIKNNLFQPGRKIMVGTSGGPDSTALMYVLAALRRRLKISLAACYLDHGLRPAETEAEKIMVRQHALALNIDFEHGVVDVRGS